jgi:dTDP-4-dehydrorhamnose reductase
LIFAAPPLPFAAGAMDILVCGGSGQVGIELRRQLWPAGVHVFAPGREMLDLEDENSVARTMAARRWACVVNVAAFTAVDRAEAEISQAWRLNAWAPALLAHEAAKLGIPIVHVSTDYVFDGASQEPYRPLDPVHPLSVYGASKEGGEQAVRTANPRHVILRTAWVVSANRTNFVKTMLKLAKNRDSLRVVDDQVGCPTSARDLAGAIRTVVLHHIAGDGDGPCGTYHFVNAGSTTWFDFARTIMAGARHRGACSVPVEPIRTAHYKTAARRPLNSVLSTDTLTRDFGIRPRAWPIALDEILDVLVEPLVTAGQ